MFLVAEDVNIEVEDLDFMTVIVPDQLILILRVTF
jgi:hypothetical protein